MPNPFRFKNIEPGSFKMLLPYFLLAVAVIIAFQVITNLGFVLAIIRRIWGIITPFFYGFLLAYIVNIPFGGIKRLLGRSRWKFIKKRKVSISLLITFSLIIVLLVLVLNLVVPAIINSITFFILNIPVYYQSLLQYIDYLNNLEIFDIYISAERITAIIQDMLQMFNIENILLSLNFLRAVPTAIFTGFLAFISSIYILIEKDKFQIFIRRLLRIFLPIQICEAIIEHTDKLNSNFKQYIKVQTIDGLILGSIVTVQLMIMGSPFAPVLGILLGVLNYVPYFGSIVATIIAIIVVAFTQNLTMALIATVVLVITQQIDANVIQPKLMGKSFSFSPLLVIISVTIGGAIAGVLGMIAAIPIVAGLKDILETISIYYEKKKFGEIEAEIIQEAKEDQKEQAE